jgi:hypothetical protein
VLSLKCYLLKFDCNLNGLNPQNDRFIEGKLFD